MNTEVPFDRFLHTQARAGRNRIGIGILHPDTAMLESLASAREFCDVVAFGAEMPKEFESIPCIATDSPEETLIKELKSGNIDAIVRGQAVATVLRSVLAREYSIPPEKIRDLGLVKDNFQRIFVPVAISNFQGWTVEQKIELIREAAAFLGLLKLPVKVGITSGARPTEMADVPSVRESYSDAEKIAGLLQGEFPIKHYYIDIEKAVADQCTVLVFANGMVGNHVLRSLVFLGGVRIYGGMIPGIDPIIVESFRNSHGFYEYLEFANALVNLRNG